MNLLAPYATKLDSLLVNSGYAYDPLIMLHQSNIFYYLSKERENEGRPIPDTYLTSGSFTSLRSMLSKEFMSTLTKMEGRQSPKIWQIISGTALVGVFAYIYSRAYQNFVCTLVNSGNLHSGF